MEGWIIFGGWTLTFFGLLWVRRARVGLHCHTISAAIAAVVYVGILLAFCYPLPLLAKASAPIQLGYFTFLGILVFPAAAAMTFFLGQFFIPRFHIQRAGFRRCVVLLTGWFFLALTLVSFLQILGVLALAFIFRTGLPNSIVRVSKDEYHLY